jgi:hypothetical protein
MQITQVQCIKKPFRVLFVHKCNLKIKVDVISLKKAKRSNHIYKESELMGCCYLGSAVYKSALSLY